MPAFRRMTMLPLCLAIAGPAACASGEDNDWRDADAQGDGLPETTDVTDPSDDPEADGEGDGEGTGDPVETEGGEEDVPGDLPADTPLDGGCGNAVLEPPEECDDGNDAPGDGCESDCLTTCHAATECADEDPCTDSTCEEGGTGRLCVERFNRAACDDAEPCTSSDVCDGAGSCGGTPVACTIPPPDECADASNLRVYGTTGTCDGSSGTAECSYPSSLQFCTYGCAGGECQSDPQQDLHIDIYVDNFCNMNVVPPEVSVPSGQTALLTYHNNSVDYPVDVWLSYGGGYLDLMTGTIWADPFEWCAGDYSYTGYADISTACSDHRLLIHCL